MEFSALRSGMSSVQTVTTDGKERYGNTMQYDQIKELIQIFEHSDLNNTGSNFRKCLRKIRTRYGKCSRGKFGSADGTDSSKS